MFGVTDYGAFVVTVVLFLLIPGPGNLALITSTGQGGLRGGMAATLGVILGDQVLMWAAVAGVAALLLAYPTAFAALQWVGAGYLAWLGLQLLKGGAGPRLVVEIQSGRYLRQTLLITLLNPKAIMFYFAFFPLFIDPGRHPGLITFAVLALTIAGLTLLYGFTLTLLVHHLSGHLRARPRVGRFLQLVAGLVLLGFGLRLALSR